MTNRVLYVNQDGDVSSTAALATQAQLAIVAQSNAIVRAEQLAAADGYSTSTQLLTHAARSVVTTPVVFMSVELTGFEATITFNPDSKVLITGFTPNVGSGTINGTACISSTIDFAFQESLQTVKPLIEWSYQLDGTPRAEWDFLGDDYVTAPVSKSGSYTDSSGNVYNNLYSVQAYVPSAYADHSFFGVWIPNDAASSDGSVMDMPGIKDGFTGTQTWGGHTLTFKGGYLVGVSE